MRKLLLLAMSGALLEPAYADMETDSAVQAFQRGNYSAAYAAFVPLAEEGDPIASYWLGNLYYDGVAVSQDVSRALYHFRQAARQGHERAQFMAGFMLYRGLGTEPGAPDYDEARQWLRPAAEAGFPLAQSLYGTLLFQGLGGEPDEMRALHWWQEAAAAGIADAQYNLALFEASQSTVSSRISALGWFLLLAQNGYPAAAQNADRLEVDLSQPEIRQAQNLARQRAQ